MLGRLDVGGFVMRDSRALGFVIAGWLLLTLFAVIAMSQGMDADLPPAVPAVLGLGCLLTGLVVAVGQSRRG
ncbi:hypothetical protein [Nonomuraea typhae]|uniref:DUF2530 domain-containing protein n=1 Tax=Nonomuraea typhae TaxID=2603600 RepID=A0ABW7YX85_9ACTN